MHNSLVVALEEGNLQVTNLNEDGYCSTGLQMTLAVNQVKWYKDATGLESMGRLGSRLVSAWFPFKWPR